MLSEKFDPDTVIQTGKFDTQAAKFADVDFTWRPVGCCIRQTDNFGRVAVDLLVQPLDYPVACEVPCSVAVQCNICAHNAAVFKRALYGCRVDRSIPIFGDSSITKGCAFILNVTNVRKDRSASETLM